MRKLLSLLPLLWLTSFTLSPVHAQSWTPGGIGVPIVCAYNASPPTVTSGSFVYAQCDNTGTLAGGGGGGGGAVTLASGAVAAGAYSAGAFVSGSFLSGAFADGAIVGVGALADAAWSSGNGTVISILKKIAGNTASFNGAVTVAAGADVSEGNITDATWSGSGNSTVIAALKAAVTGINAGYDSTLQATRTTPTSNSTPIACGGTATTSAANATGLGTTSIHGFTIQNNSTTINLCMSLSGTAVCGDNKTFTLGPLGSSLPNSFTTPAGFGSNTNVSLISASSTVVYACTAF